MTAASDKTAIRAILWDFDGVIVDSEAIRIEGFRTILRDHPQPLVERLVEYHMANGGISRFEKIRYFFREILFDPASEETVQDLAVEFSDIMRERMTDPSILIPETVAFLKRECGRYRFHVVTGSDEDEVRFLCERLGIASFFVSLHGSPTPKPDVVKTVMKENGYRPEETIFIGDSVYDREAARESGLDFFGYNNPDLEPTSDFYIETFKTFDPGILTRQR